MRFFRIRTTLYPSSYFPWHLTLYEGPQGLLNWVTSEELWQNQLIAFAFGFLLLETSFLTHSILKRTHAPINAGFCRSAIAALTSHRRGLLPLPGRWYKLCEWLELQHKSIHSHLSVLLSWSMVGICETAGWGIVIPRIGRILAHPCKWQPPTYMMAVWNNSGQKVKTLFSLLISKSIIKTLLFSCFYPFLWYFYSQRENR